MEEGLDLHTALQAAGFLLLVGMAVWHRLRLLREMADLPDDAKLRLGWIWSGETSARRHRRVVARRLMVRGLPDWVPLSEEGRRDLFWHRVFGLGSAVYLVVVLPAVWGVWILIPVLGVPVAVVLAIQSWFDGPWGAETGDERGAAG